MKKLFNFACASIFFLFGAVLSAQTADSGPEITITCNTGECTTSVTTSEDSWSMMIDCGDDGTWSGGGSGAWGGSLCGVSVIFE